MARVGHSNFRCWISKLIDVGIRVSESRLVLECIVFLLFIATSTTIRSTKCSGISTTMLLKLPDDIQSYIFHTLSSIEICQLRQVCWEDLEVIDTFLKFCVDLFSTQCCHFGKQATLAAPLPSRDRTSRFTNIRLPASDWYCSGSRCYSLVQECDHPQ